MDKARDYTMSKKEFTTVNKGRFGLKALSVAGLAGLFMLGGVLGASGQSNNPITPSGDTNTQVNQGGNNVPVVDIAGPNSQGVSHNQFNDYNVNEQGIVLNNSLTGGQSQLAGQLGANANLGSNSASVIINEVVKANRSHLLGPTEVFGNPAHLIVANPYGITCRGCGFMNTDRVTLSTGRPMFDSEGAYTGLDVDEGDIVIEQTTNRPDGQNFGADVTGLTYFDIVARSIKINGLIKGDLDKTQVGLFAGRNIFKNADRTVEAKEDDGTTGFGIDSSLLGGAYANKITLIATEKGVGIRTPAEMKAAYGGIQLRADGKIVLGKATSQGKITVQSDRSHIEFAKNVFSETALEVTANQGNVDVLDGVKVSSAGNVSLSTQSVNLSNGALLGAGLNENGEFSSGGKLTVVAANLNNRGSLRSGGDLDIDVTGNLDNSGEIIGQKTAKLLVGGVFTNETNGTIQIAGNLDFDVAQFVNSGSVSSGGNLLIANASKVENTGTIASGGNVTLDGVNTLDNKGSITGKTFALLNGDIVTNSGTITGTQGIEFGFNAGGSLTNSGDITSQGGVKVDGAGTLTNEAGGSISGRTVALLNGGLVTNHGSIKGQDKVDLTFNTDGSLENSGSISSDGTVSVAGAKTLNNSGDILSQSGIVLNNVGALNNTGTVSGQSIALSNGGSLYNSGSLISEAGNLTIEVSGDIDNVGDGVIRASGTVSLDAGGDVTNGIDGQITAGTDLNITAQTLYNDGALQQDGEKGLLSAGGSVNFNVAVLDNFGDVTAGKDINIDASDSVYNTFGRIEASNDVKIKAVNVIENVAGTIRGRNVDTDAKTVRNLDVVKRDDVVVLPEAVLARLDARTKKLVEKSVQAYRDQLTTVDDKAVEAFRAKLLEKAKHFLDQTSSVELLKNSRNALAGLERSMQQELSSALAKANGTVPAKQQGFFSRLKLGAKDVKAAKEKTSFLGTSVKNQARTVGSGIFGWTKLNQSKSGGGNYTETLAGKAQITATNNLSIKATQDIEAVGGRLEAGNNLTLNAGRHLDISASRIQTVNNKRIKGGFNNLSTTTYNQAELIAGGNVTLESNEDTVLRAANIEAGKHVTINAGGRVDIAGEQDVYDKHYYRKKKHWSGFSKKIKEDKEYSTTTVKTTIKSGGDVNIVADEKEVRIKGSDVEAQGGIRVASRKSDVILEASRDVLETKKRNSKSSWWGLQKKDKTNKGFAVNHKPTFVSGIGLVELHPNAGDLKISGSIVESRAGIDIQAQNVYLEAVFDERHDYERILEQGFFADSFSGDGGAGFTFGWKSEEHETLSIERKAVQAALAANGNITINAANDVVSKAGIIGSVDGSIRIKAGNDVKLLSVHEVFEHIEKHDVFQVGVTVSVQEHVTSAIETLKNTPDSFNSGKGNGAYEAISKISAVLEAADAINTLVNGNLASASISLGISSNKSKFAQKASIVQVGIVTAAVDVSVEAGRDIIVEGGQQQQVAEGENVKEQKVAVAIGKDGELLDSPSNKIQSDRQGKGFYAGNNFSLNAGRDVELKSAVSTITETSKTRNRSASIGVTAGVGISGVNVSGNVGFNMQNGDSKAVTKEHNHAEITAGNTFSVTSGKDTLVKGAIVEAGNIETNVGGNLNVESVQDTFTMRSKDIGFGVSLSMGLYSSGWGGEKGPNGSKSKGPSFKDAWDKSTSKISDVYNGKGEHTKTAGISFNYGKGKADVAWTNQVSGFYAGDSLTVNTKGNTHVKGAALWAGNGEPVVNSGTFTWENIKDYNKSSSFNIAGSYSFDFGGPKETAKSKEQEKTRLALLGPVSRALDGLPPVSVEGHYEKSVTEQVTRATVNKDTRLNIRDKVKQDELEKSGKTKKFAAINRDVDAVQEITKEEHEYVRVYATASSIKAIGKGVDKAISYLEDLVKEGKITPAQAKEEKKLRELYLRGKLKFLCGEQQHGWLLHDIFFTPAYAAGEGCVGVFKGASALYKDGKKLSQEQINRITASIAQEQYAKAKNHETQITNLTNDLKKAEAAGLTAKANKIKLQIKDHDTKLNFILENIVLCTSHTEFQNTILSNPFYNKDKYKKLFHKARLNKASTDGFFLNVVGTKYQSQEKMIQTAEANLDARKIDSIFNFSGKRKNQQLFDLIVGGGTEKDGFKEASRQAMTRSITKAYGAKVIDMSDAMRKEFLSDSAKTLAWGANEAGLDSKWSPSQFGGFSFAQLGRYAELSGDGTFQFKRDHINPVTNVIADGSDWFSSTKLTGNQVASFINTGLGLTDAEAQQFNKEVHNSMYNYWKEDRSLQAYGKGIKKHYKGVVRSGEKIVGLNINDPDSMFVPVYSPGTDQPLEVVDKSTVQRAGLTIDGLVSSVTGGYKIFDVQVDESKKNHLYVDLKTGMTVEVNKKTGEVISTVGDYVAVVDGISDLTGVAGIVKAGGKFIVKSGVKALAKGGSKGGLVQEGLQLASANTAKAAGPVTSTVGKVTATAKTTAEKIATTAKSTAGKVATTAKSTAGKVATTAKSTAGKVATTAKSTAGKVATTAKSTAGKVATTAKSTAGKVATAAKSTAGKVATAAKSTVGKAATASKFATKPAAKAAAMLKNTAGSAANKFGKVASKAGKSLKAGASKAKKFTKVAAVKARVAAKSGSNAVKSRFARVTGKGAAKAKKADAPNTPKVASKGPSGTKNPCASFAPHTPVLMADGSFKAIIDIRVGDQVAARNEFTKLYSSRPVTHLPSSIHTDRVTVEVAGASGAVETIVTTVEHPFYVEGQGFVDAGKLKVGMVLSQWQPKASPVHTVGFRESEASGALRVKAVTVEGDGVPEWRAYNLTVGVDHTYYVGDAKVWVHNADPDCFDKLPAGAKVTDELTDDGRKVFKFKDSSGVERRVYQGHGFDTKFYDLKKVKPTPKTWEDLYPPRDMVAVTEARNVIDLMGNGIFGKASNRVVTVVTHKNGTVSVGISGELGSKTFVNKVNALQKALDKKYGPNKYSVSKEPFDGSHGIKTITNEAGSCAEPKCFNIAGKNPSPVQSSSTQWRGEADKNPYPYKGRDKDKITKHLETEMAPCDTCSNLSNADIYTSNLKR